MVTDIEDDFFNDMNDAPTDEVIDNNNSQGSSLAEKHAQEQAQKNLLARKRIDELKEKKRLKDLLDDSDDW